MLLLTVLPSMLSLFSGASIKMTFGQTTDFATAKGQRIAGVLGL